jgi:hypothetical protein
MIEMLYYDVSYYSFNFLKFSIVYQSIDLAFQNHPCKNPQSKHTLNSTVQASHTMVLFENIYDKTLWCCSINVADLT